MLNVSLFLIAGIFVGYVLRERSRCLSITEKISMLFILLLLFLLGVSLGRNKTVLSNLSVFGLQAAVITVGGILGSITLSFFTYKYFFQGRRKR